ncbi:hypothetical protein J4Q44_G00066130 [Coregonus suidteri]|uniref:Uncharacterized protein n=1 Tax=Coregonus suidteri TaxID=861788 RepID=A0AAN8R5G3_9TELE
MNDDELLRWPIPALHSLTLGSAHCAGQQMKRKLMSILRLKCHALFLDRKSMPVPRVCPFGQKGGQKPSYFLNLIWDMAEYTNQLVQTLQQRQAWRLFTTF